jgi:predicted aldo/keto reductase-like oxidoreductase
MLDAKKAGKLRYIGFTGHKSPEIHLKMLATAESHNFHFDTVQMPINVMDAHFDSFTSKVIPVLLKNEIGVLGMKPLAAGIVLQTNTASAVECLRYAMTLPTSVVITGCDSMDILKQALGVAKNFQPMTRDEIATLLAKTAPVAASGQYEPYKTTEHFDGTTRNPEWMG